MPERRTAQCPHFHDADFLALLTGELPAQRQAALEQHLTQCADCTARQTAIARLFLVAGSQKETVPPVALQERIFANLTETPVASKKKGGKTMSLIMMLRD